MDLDSESRKLSTLLFFKIMLLFSNVIMYTYFRYCLRIDRIRLAPTSRPITVQMAAAIKTVSLKDL